MHAWVVDCTIVDGREFVQLDKSDRKLARAMGRDMKSRTPWHNNELLPYVAKLRDDAVDALIAKDRHDNDPMADEAVQLPMPKIGRGRGKSVSDAKVPDIIDITYPAFDLANGEQHPPVVMSVLSTTRRGKCASVELTTANLDLLLAAADACERESPLAKPGEKEELLSEKVDLEQPDCKWRRRGTKCMVSCSYLGADGAWHVHSEVPPLCEDRDAQVVLVREAEKRVQQFYSEHHVADADGSQAEA